MKDKNYGIRMVLIIILVIIRTWRSQWHKIMLLVIVVVTGIGLTLNDAVLFLYPFSFNAG